MKRLAVLLLVASLGVAGGAVLRWALSRRAPGARRGPPPGTPDHWPPVPRNPGAG